MADRWKDFGSCREVGPDLFFGEHGESTKQAISICSVCPVRQRCLNYAIDNNLEHGIWGGATPNARRKVKKAA